MAKMEGGTKNGDSNKKKMSSESKNKKKTKGKPKSDDQKEDQSIEILKAENKERLYAFNLPQPPGDPKLLEFPVDLKTLKMDIDMNTAKKIGHLGIQLLQTRHMHSGTQRRAELPAVNLKEGLRVLSFVPYNLESNAHGVSQGQAKKKRRLDQEDIDIMVGNKKQLITKYSGDGMGQRSSSSQKLNDISGKMNWVMNTTYITSNSGLSKGKRRTQVKKENNNSNREGETALNKDNIMLEGASGTAMGDSLNDLESIQKSFELVKQDDTLDHPTKKGVKMVESIPLVPFKMGQGYGEHVQVQMNAIYVSADQTKSSILKGNSIRAKQGDGKESVISLFTPTQVEKDGETGEEVQKFKCVQMYRFEALQRGYRKGSFALSIKDGVATYIDLNAALALKRITDREEAVNEMNTDFQFVKKIQKTK